MAPKQSLELEQRLGLRLSQQQLRFSRLLEQSAPEIEETVERELADNPALEKEDTIASESSATVEEIDERGGYRGIRESGFVRSEGVDPGSWTPDNISSLYDFLHEQLLQRNLSERMRRIATYIIGSLDSNGYLRREPSAIADDLTFNEGLETDTGEVEEGIEVVRSLEPYGVGASDLRKCLEIQLRHKPVSEVRDNALRIVRDEFKEFTLRHDHKLMTRLHLSEEEVRAATALIRSLNPKPGAAVGNTVADRANVIVPDFYVIPEEDGELRVTVANRIPELRIDESFSRAVEIMKERADERRLTEGEQKNRQFIVSRYNDARDFIKILKRRQETLLSVMTAIVTIQKEYFETADVFKLRSMMLKDVSALTGLDFSVISRATANKHLATPWGIFPLRFFFSDSVAEGSGDTADNKEDGIGEVMTNRKIEQTIRELVEKEDKRHPLSDERLRELIVESGYNVSRRTVAKYRDRIGIPVARLRKEL